MLLLTMALCCILASCASKSEISEAADTGNLEKVKALLKDKPNLVFAKDIYDDTPLHFAATKEVAELLIAKGANVNAKDKWGNTPLHLAASDGHMDVIKVLLAHGADVNAKAPPIARTGGDWTPMHGASDSVKELLRQHGGHE